MGFSRLVCSSIARCGCVHQYWATRPNVLPTPIISPAVSSSTRLCAGAFKQAAMALQPCSMRRTELLDNRSMSIVTADADRLTAAS